MTSVLPELTPIEGFDTRFSFDPGALEFLHVGDSLTHHHENVTVVQIHANGCVDVIRGADRTNVWRHRLGSDFRLCRVLDEKGIEWALPQLLPWDHE